MDNIFRILLKVSPFHHHVKGVPPKVIQNEILTGYIGEKMHHNFYMVNRFKKRM